MKWCFIVNNAPFLTEFFIKLSREVVKTNDECLVILTSKFVEYEKKMLFPAPTKFISKVDWIRQSYRPGSVAFHNVSWKEFFPLFDRSKRISLDYEKAFDRTDQDYQFYQYIFESENPDLILFEPPSGIGTEIAYLFARERKIPYLGILVSRIPDRLEICDLECVDAHSCSLFEHLLMEEITSEEREFAQNYIRSFLLHTKVPSYVGTQKVIFSPLGFIWHYIQAIRKKGKALVWYAKIRKEVKRYDVESEIRWMRSFAAPLEMLRRQFRILSQKRIYSLYDERDKNRFFVYPLQLQPETSTSLCATYYNDQLSTIQNIAFTLPFPYKLYVKEHPAAIGTRENLFYKRLKKIPHVVLIAPEEQVSRLIKNCCGVITLTSTVGMESALAGKPTYVLGSAAYEYHPLCRKISSFDQLRESLRQDRERPPESPDLQELNLRFIVSYLRRTLQGDIIASCRETDSNNYAEIYQSFRRRALELRG